LTKVFMPYRCSGAHDNDAIEMARAGGLVMIATIGSVAEAKVAQASGADVIVAQGWEAGRHVWGRVATMALVPAVVDAVTLPVVAAGGISDGRGMAAALMLGAAGVWVGTRFLASPETRIHETYRQAVLDASGEQAEWYADLYDRHWRDAPHRALSNATSRKWQDADSPRSGSRPEEGQVIGTRPGGGEVLRYESYTPRPGTTGDVAAMSLWCGQCVGLVHEMKGAALFPQITMRRPCSLGDWRCCYPSEPQHYLSRA
jgi:nitronate monooxygenase